MGWSGTSNTLGVQYERTPGGFLWATVALDLVLLTGFAVVLITKSPRHALPLAPLLMLPALALLPVLRQLGAVKREMARRGTAAPQQ